MVCQIISIDSHTLQENLLCPKCKEHIVPVNDLACCAYCNTITVESFCLESNVGPTVCSIEDNSKVNLTTQFNLLQ